VAAVYEAKGRPSFNPLIAHVADLAMARRIARFDDRAEALAARFWPGPLTLVLPRGPRALDVVTAGQDTVALRVPSHPVALEILRRLGGGVAAPSANRFGRTSPTTAEHVRQDLGGDVELIVDGGPASIGVESTIVDLTSDPPALLRPGGVPREELERVLGRPLMLRSSGGAVRAPGMLPSHYAPRAGVVLAVAEAVVDQVVGLLARGQRVGVISPGRELPAGVGHIVVPADASGMARELYGSLREADRMGFEVVVVQLPPEGGLGLAVRDRLKRAAAPRES